MGDDTLGNEELIQALVDGDLHMEGFTQGDLLLVCCFGHLFTLYRDGRDCPGFSGYCVIL
jgi:hypothetical protein